jgi:hypothetical protein
MTRKRYSHWFWNSKAMQITSKKVGKLGCYLWRKMYDNENKY